MKNILKKQLKWILTITILAFVLTIIISTITDISIGNANIIIVVLVVLIIVFLGIIFDTVGIAVAAGKKESFHAMNAQKVKHAKYSLFLLDNASKTCSILNDVIGDISGIISGTGVMVIVLKILEYDISFLNKTIISVLVSAVLASLTIGGKAIGKEIAMLKSKEIVNISGKVLYFINEKMKIRFIKFKNKSKRQGK